MCNDFGHHIKLLTLPKFYQKYEQISQHQAWYKFYSIFTLLIFSLFHLE